MFTWLAVGQISCLNSKSIDMNFDHKQFLYMYVDAEKKIC